MGTSRTSGGMTREQAIELVRGLLAAYAKCERCGGLSLDQALLNYVEIMAAVIDALIATAAPTRRSFCRGRAPEEWQRPRILS